MRRIKAMGLAVGAALAISAIATGTASAAKLTLTEGGSALAPGAFFEIVGEGAMSFETSEGTIECDNTFESSALEVEVVTNSKGNDELRIARFSGNSEDGCESFTGNASAELNVSGPLRLRGSGRATTGPVSARIHFLHVFPEDQEADCVYTAGHFDGTNPATPTPHPLSLALAGLLKLNRADSSAEAKRLCPKTTEVELSLPDTENGALETEMIDEQT
jgi:hypothetical protein